MDGDLCCAVLFVADPLEAEQILLAGNIACPHCHQPLRPHGRGRTRTVRGWDRID